MILSSLFCLFYFSFPLVTTCPQFWLPQFNVGLGLNNKLCIKYEILARFAKASELNTFSEIWSFQRWLRDLNKFSSLEQNGGRRACLQSGELCLFSGHGSKLLSHQRPRGSSCKDKFKIVFREISSKVNSGDSGQDPMVGFHEDGDEH
jgi:hypothetical protein